MPKDDKTDIDRNTINGLTSISNWVHPRAVYIEEFFLTKTGYPLLYKKSLERFEKSKQEAIASGKSPETIKEPILQLSPKGLSLLMALFSEKEQTMAQPLIASDIASFLYLIELMRQAPNNIRIVVIYQPTDNQDKLLYNRHKTVFKIEKESNTLRIINLDSCGPLFGEVTLNNLRDKIAKHDISHFKYLYYSQKPLLKIDLHSLLQPDNILAPYSRQQDDYQCGTFAVKDAKQMLRDDNFSKQLEAKRTAIRFPPFVLFEYTIPSNYYKVVQSEKKISMLLPVFGTDLVTRHGEHLSDTYRKHQIEPYVDHFSEKYRDQVIEFVKTHDTETIKKATELFDASKMTTERLISIYGISCQDKQEETDPISPLKPPMRP